MSEWICSLEVVIEAETAEEAEVEAYEAFSRLVADKVGIAVMTEDEYLNR